MQGGHPQYYNQNNINQFKQKVDIFVSCRNLRNLDVMSKTDPQVILYSKTQDGSFHEIDRTENIRDNLNPNFTHNFRLDYIFETHQYFKIKVIDVDKSNFDELGESEFKMADVMGSRKCSIKIPLKHKGKDNGEVILRGEAVSQDDYDLRIQCQGIELKCFSLMGHIHPILKFYKPRLLSKDPEYLNNLKKQQAGFAGPKVLNSEDWINVYTSEKGKDGNSKFNMISIQSSKFCSSLKDIPLKVNFFSYKSAQFLIITAMELTSTKESSHFI